MPASQLGFNYTINISPNVVFGDIMVLPSLPRPPPHPPPLQLLD